MVNKYYIPKQGDIMWLDFNPQKGKEIMKRRPALVLSDILYNKCELALVCPITSTIKNNPFEVIIKTKEIEGAILSDQIKNLDWKGRNATFIDKISKNDFLEVLKLLSVIIKPNN